MPCKPIYPPYPDASPPLPIPGIGIPFAPVQLPIPNWKFPPVFPEMIDELLKKFKLGWPGFTDGIQAAIDNTANDVLRTIMNILGMLSPYLSLYNLFQAVLNLIMCIIEVLCALPSPIPTIIAVNKLITQCIPPFLNIFPFLALLAMIIAIIILIIALIEYIIAKVIQLIKDLIRNFKILYKAISLHSAESIAAAAMKVANIFCIIQGIFAVLSTVAGIIAIINTLLNMGMPQLCFGNNGSACCSDDHCPKFISQTENGFTGATGELTYIAAYNPTPSGGTVNPGAAPANFTRSESWQIINKDTGATYKFKDIITAVGTGGTYWPATQTFELHSDPQQVPYTGSLKFNLDTTGLANSDKIGGIRTFIVTDVFVTSRPYYGVNQWDGTVVADSTGTLSLTGGKVWVKNDNTPDSATDPFSLKGYVSYPGHLNTLVSMSPTNSWDSSSSQLVISNVQFQVTPNLSALLLYQLIGYGCLPQLKKAADLVTAQIPDYVIPPIPDPPQECLTASLDKFRANPTEDGANTFQKEFQECLLNYQATLETDLCSILRNAISVYHNTLSVSPDVQFVDNPIKLTVVLKDVNDVVLSTNIPEVCVPEVLSNLKATVTFGTVSDFQYNNGELFANINSSVAGSGTVKVQYIGSYFKKVTVPTDPAGSTVITDLYATYTFVGTSLRSSEGEVRRDERDVVGV